MRIRLYFLIVLLTIALSLLAKIQINPILGDNMVLQRNSEVNIWGKATPGQKIKVISDWNNHIYSTLTNNNGDWKVTLKTTDAGGPYTLSVCSRKEKIVLKNILLGEVWLCSGQSNMEMRMLLGYMIDSPVNGVTDALINADNPSIRLFRVGRSSHPLPQDTCSGHWLVANAETVSDFSAVAYYFARYLQQRLKVPVGVISSSWGGSKVEAWMKRETIAKFPEAYKITTDEKMKPHELASQLYNGMIAPVLNYKIKGALWYQGESNIGNYYDYSNLLTAMLDDWRKGFNAGNFPFYYVEIAPYSYKNSLAKAAAFQREAQYKAMQLIPNSGMVTTVDLGEEDNIHPAEKEAISKRLFLWALSETYGVNGIPYKSPVFKNMTVNDSVATLSFENGFWGFTSYGKPVESFEVAGSDSVFYPASVNIIQRKLQVKSLKVKTPVAVRYCFRNFSKTKGYIYSTAGLPMLPFRTDNWKK